ncbi:aspartate kinase [Lacticaseibacillus absianus]|uniref:aspartate kinase n=1 Tax=Lacticaseibacillus absianus TaxID=2729623 RepID=UPI0015CBCBA0
MKVIKFGGSSLATGPQLAKVLDIIAADPTRRVVVVSAPGKRFKGDIKVTDLLGQLAQAVIAGADVTASVDAIIARYADITADFGMPDTIVGHLRQHLLQMTRQSYLNLDYLTATFMAQGEFMNARLVAAVMRHRGVNARFVDPKALGMVVSGRPRAANIAPDSYARIAEFNLAPDETIIVPGFFAYDRAGHIATFARGGSDITGSILARGLGAELYENFTDVSSVYAADPRIVAHPRAIKTLTYREMRELAYAGFTVFNDEAIIPMSQANIPVNVKNTNEPAARGTIIAPTKNVNHHHHITGVAAKHNFVALYLHRYLINAQVGFTLRLLRIFEQYGVSYEHMPSGIDDLTVIIDKAQLGAGIKEALTDDITRKLHPDHLEWLDDIAILMVVGEGLYAKPTIIAQIMGCLADIGIAPSILNQGASRISLMLGVPADRAADAVRAIYALSETHPHP